MTEMTQPLWAIVPTLDLVDMALQTCDDLLAQTVPVRVLLIDQGSSQASNDAFREYADRHHPNVVLWSFTPPLPSLSAAWNRGLQFVWASGGEEALVVNSDVRLLRHTAVSLQVARGRSDWFVSGVGVAEDQFTAARDADGDPDDVLSLIWGGGKRPTFFQSELPKGGPDFSCFLITQRAHERYPFDEHFIPCYGEDCDLHRRYLLNGDGDLIFSVNLPFHHIKGGSRTINQSPEARARFDAQAAIGRAYYKQKWGGGPNQETFSVPFSGDAWPNVTLPELQARVAAGLQPLDGVLRARMTEDAVVGEVVYQPPLRELTPEEEIAAVEAAFAKKAAELRVTDPRLETLRAFADRKPGERPPSPGEVR